MTCRHASIGQGQNAGTLAVSPGAALRRRRLLATLAASAWADRATAQASAYPARPVRIIVPGAAGSGQDVVARVVGQHLAGLWGQAVIVENRQGAAGVIGTEAVVKAPPDGYTLGIVNVSALAISPVMIPNVSYDPMHSFEFLGLAVTNDAALAVRAASPFRSVEDVVTAATARPQQLTWASAGSGTATQMAGELFAQTARIRLIHVPYRGSPPAITDLLGGQVDMTFNTINALLPGIRTGSIRALATTGRTRDPLLPEVPTFAETGYPGYEASGWIGFAAPLGVPVDIVAKLGADIRRVTASEAFERTIEQAGMRPRSSSPAEFRDYVREEIGRWGDVVRRSAATLD